MLSDVSGILDGKGQLIAEVTQAKADELIAAYMAALYLRRKRPMLPGWT